MNFRHIFFFLLAIVLLGTERDLSAQWYQVSDTSFAWKDSLHHYLGRDLPEGGLGALAVSGSTVWVGQNGLWFSEDTAKTWHRSGLNLLSTSLIHDINFFDRKNGLVATSDFGVMKTTDGGKTWKQILLEAGIDFWKAMFNGLPNIIHATSSEKGVCYTSTDGGGTWSQSYLGPYVSAMAIAADHTVYVFAQETYLFSGRGWINYSTDFGVTWQRDSLSFADGDSYTLAVDSCNKNKLYLLNEDYATSNDNTSEIFITSDLGRSWKSYDHHDIPYFSGALATTAHSLFAGTFYDSIIRSTDKGLSWQKIGGPVISADSRTIEAMNDNILFAIYDSKDQFHDQFGQICYTLNCGGHYFNPPPPPHTSLNFSSRRIINDSNNIQIHLPLYFQHSGDLPDIDFIVHYPSSPLKVIDARLYNGKRIDISTASWEGRLAIHVSGADLNDAHDSLLGYINFLWNPIEYDCTHITFDSIMTGDACYSYSVTPFEGIIGTLPSCAASGVASNNQKGSDLIFSPNPASEFGMLSSQNFSGEIHVRMYDNLGRITNETSGEISPVEPLRISLHGLPSGIYETGITMGNTLQRMRIAIVK